VSFLGKVTTEKFLRLHAFVHLDERRPGAFETFARQFLRRINAEFAADGDLAGGAAVRTFNPEKSGAGRA
jgi:hypothetical protein